MKKLLALFITLALVFACSACTPREIYESVNNESTITSTNSELNQLDSIVTGEKEKENTDDNISTESTTVVPVKKECVHEYTQATCTTPQICTKCGATRGTAVGHSYTKSTCITPQTCTICGATQGEAEGHSYTKANCITVATCTKCGVTQGELGGHEYSYTSCSAPGVCINCDVKQNGPAGHDYVLGECVRVVSGKICGDYNSSYCPKIYFTGNMSSMTDKKDIRNITFEYRSKDKIINGAAKIKVQGSSSLMYNKKNYTINFYENDKYTKKLGINVGWGAQDEYCLKANWIDKTHSRNVVTAKLVGEAQEKYGLFETSPNNGAIDGFPVEVYINGDFHGVYTMNIPKADWMFSMDEKNSNNIVICSEGWQDANLFKADPDFNTWSVEVGEENEETLKKMKRLFSFVRNSSDAEFVENFEQYLNLDATLNYYVMMDYGWMADNMGKNMLLATYDGKVWYPALYDLDTTWGVNWQGTSEYNYKNTLQDFSDSMLWSRMEQLFSKELAERYFELRQDVLDPAHVMSTFKNFYNTIPKEVLAREKEKWGNNIPGYDINQIQGYLNSVVPRLDEKYNAWL